MSRTNEDIINWIKESIKKIEDMDKLNKYYTIETLEKIHNDKIIKGSVKIEVEVMDESTKFHSIEWTPYSNIKGMVMNNTETGRIINSLPICDLYAFTNNGTVFVLAYYNNSVSLYPILISFIDLQGSILLRKTFEEEKM